MLEGAPRLRVPVAFACVAAIMIILSFEFRPNLIGSILFVVGVIVIVAALVYGIDWIWHRASLYYTMLLRIKAQTPQVLMMQAITQMNEQQLAFANSLNTVISFLPGEPAPVMYSIIIGEMAIPYDFVKTFVKLSDESHLPPVRQWPDGSTNRRFAVAITNHLILSRYANPGKGNQSATWLDKRSAMMSLGLILPDGREQDMTTLGDVNRWSGMQQETEDDNEPD